jgi:hypothetical protein
MVHLKGVKFYDNPYVRLCKFPVVCDRAFKAPAYLHEHFCGHLRETEARRKSALSTSWWWRSARALSDSRLPHSPHHQEKAPAEGKRDVGRKRGGAAAAGVTKVR